MYLRGSDRCHTTPGGRKPGANIGCRKQPFQHMSLVEVGVCVCVLCKAGLYEKASARHCGGVCLLV